MITRLAPHLGVVRQRCDWAEWLARIIEHLPWNGFVDGNYSSPRWQDKLAEVFIITQHHAIENYPQPATTFEDQHGVSSISPVNRQVFDDGNQRSATTNCDPYQPVL